MIRNQWYVVLESKELGRKPAGVTRLGERLIFWREPGTGKAVCFYDRCAHRGASFRDAVCVNANLRCPFHGLEYDASGRCVLIPANGKTAPVPPEFRLRAYPTHEAHGYIFIWWGTDIPETLEPPRFFDDIDDSFLYASVRDPWDNHYTRVIENQLDMAHVPFVHYNTIGRGNRTMVEGPGVRWVRDDLFHVFVYNKVDDGSRPRTPDEVPVPRPNGLKLEFLFPNLWENYISDHVRVTAAFVPVDEEHTLVYLRFCQNFLKLPGLGKLVCLLGGPLNLAIAHQDRRVVNTQIPKRDGTGSGELLFPGDRAIFEFRKHRAVLRKKTGEPQSVQTATSAGERSGGGA